MTTLFTKVTSFFMFAVITFITVVTFPPVLWVLVLPIFFGCYGYSKALVVSHFSDISSLYLPFTRDVYFLNRSYKYILRT